MMINIYIKIKNDGILNREHISAWIYSKLSSKYHDDGLEKYFNGSGVKAHTFYFAYGKNLKKDDIECIQLRGIEPIEKKLMGSFDMGEIVRLGKVNGEVYYIEKEEYKHKNIYTIQSPLVMRYSDKTLDIKKNSYYKTLVPSDIDMTDWSQVVIDSLIRRAVLIYGRDIEEEFRNFNLITYKEVKTELNIKGKKMVYDAVLGKIKIDADEFWHEFIQRVGLGNRNTYGFGIVG